MLPSVADMLCYMRGLRPADKIGFAFGSYGWSGEAVRLITEALEDMKVNIVDSGIRVKFTPTHDDFKKVRRTWQKGWGRQLRTRHKGQPVSPRAAVRVVGGKPGFSESLVFG